MITPEEEKEIEALIHLIDDPDENVFNQIKNKIISKGEEIIPKLEGAWEHQNFGLVFQERIEHIIHSIQLKSIHDKLREWVESSEQDLLKAMLIINRYQYPELNEQKILDQIKQLEQEIWLELRIDLTALEKVRIINHILFEIHGFGGNAKNYHAPQNSFLSDVLETKKGNPISLAILYSILAQRNSIPLKGVNLPRHFILAYLDFNPLDLLPIPRQHPVHPNVLFYVNPFSRGSVFSRQEIDSFLNEIKVEPNDSYYFPCPNKEIIKRVINNLLYSYSKSENKVKTDELKEIAMILN
jgi:regulator of sirC expression with transglutaminase-like and TPR domain